MLNSLMEKKNIRKFEFFFLIIAGLCYEVLLIERTIHMPTTKKTWTAARHFCQKYHTDLITRKVMSESTFITESQSSGQSSSMWVGLYRDPMNDTLWNWIDEMSGKGLTGHNDSSSDIWGDTEQSSHCAMVGVDQLWHSEPCTKKYRVHCSNGNNFFRSSDTMTWHHGLKYCQLMNGSISVISQASLPGFTGSGWIGLHRSTKSKWVWVRNSSSLFTNWAPGEPITKDCGSVERSSGRFYSHECSTELNFVCYDDNVVVVNENKTWEEALRHCQNITNQIDNSNNIINFTILNLGHLKDYDYIRQLLNKATTDEVWIGLRFLGAHWLWMDGETPDHQGELPSCPPLTAHCGILSKYDTKNWIIRNCIEKKNFLCRKHIFYQENLNTVDDR